MLTIETCKSGKHSSMPSPSTNITNTSITSTSSVRCACWLNARPSLFVILIKLLRGQLAGCKAGKPL